jgi:hypothetical protein
MILVKKTLLDKLIGCRVSIYVMIFATSFIRKSHKIDINL